MCFEESNELSHGAGAMADGVLHLVAQLGKRLVVAFGNEDRIVAKSTVTMTFGIYAAFDYAFKIMCLSIFDESDDGTKLCTTVLNA